MTRADLKAVLEIVNVRAFLAAIRLGEGTSSPLGYHTIVGGQTFTDDSKHPNVRVWIERYKVWSTAAGAYQFIRPTWDGLVRQYGFPDFSPDCQDEGAVALIAERGALADIEAGSLAAAIHKCRNVWASLPGAEAGQRTESYAAVRKVYVDAGGALA